MIWDSPFEVQSRIWIIATANSQRGSFVFPILDSNRKWWRILSASNVLQNVFGSRKPTPNTVSEGVWNFGAGSEQRILSLQDIAHELFMALDLDGDAGVSWAATWLQLRLLFKTPWKLKGLTWVTWGLTNHCMGDVMIMGMLHLNRTMGLTTMNPGGPVLDKRTGWLMIGSPEHQRCIRYP